MTQKQIGPWKCLGSREIYRNQWMRLREDQVIHPGGKPGVYGVIEFAPRCIRIRRCQRQVNSYFFHVTGVAPHIEL